MTTKLRHLYPSFEFPAIAAGDSDAVPLRALEALVQEARRRIRAAGGPVVYPDDEARFERECDSAMVSGVSAMRIVYSDELTQFEALRDQTAEQAKVLDELRAIFKDHDARDPGVRRIKELLGLSTEPAAPSRQEWERRTSTWPVQTHAELFVHEARRTGVTLSMVTQWNGPEAARLIAEAAVRMGLTLEP